MYTPFVNVKLINHPTARNAAASAIDILPGTVIATIPALSTVLLPKEKGIRCDHCLHSQSVDSTFKLRRCSGCSSYWYCSEICQKNQWKEHHKQICKSYSNYVSSECFLAMSENEKLDALLLTHLIAQMSSKSRSGDIVSPLYVFLSLMRSSSGGKAPFICPITPVPSFSNAYLDDIYGRFDNNNYILHSHLIAYAHGIFPWASRLFNHSCSPNAVPKYIITVCQPVQMQLVSLRNIAEGEEITIPYTDPAISFSRRQQHLQKNYGFQCHCEACEVQKHMNITFSISSDPQYILVLERQLQELVFKSSPDQRFRLPNKPLYDILPNELHSVLHDSFLTDLTETFSNASKDGPYDLALFKGKSILAVYLCIYPPLYPQIGLHALELSKTFWNAFITVTIADGTPEKSTRSLLSSADSYLSIAKQILMNFGPEGDLGGPLDEVSYLESLIIEEYSRLP